MGSRFAAIKRESKVGSLVTNRLCDFDETDPYYFMVKENGRILAEGSITKIRFLLPEELLHKKIKTLTKDSGIMLATVEY